MAEPKKLWDNFEVVGEVQKSDSIKLLIAAATRNGIKYISIREFYLRKKDNVWKPARDGITLPINLSIDHGNTELEPAGELVKTVTQACLFASTMKLKDDDKAVYYTPKENY